MTVMESNETWAYERGKGWVKQEPTDAERAPRTKKLSYAEKRTVVKQMLFARFLLKTITPEQLIKEWEGKDV